MNSKTGVSILTDLQTEPKWPLITALDLLSGNITNNVKISDFGRLAASQEDAMVLYDPGLKDQLSSRDSEHPLMLRGSLAAEPEKRSTLNCSGLHRLGRVQQVFPLWDLSSVPHATHGL